MKASKFKKFCTSRMSHSNFHNPIIAREANISRSEYFMKSCKNNSNIATSNILQPIV